MLHILLLILVAGVILWAINSFVPMDAKFKQIFNIVAVVALIIYLVKAFHLLSYLH